MKICRTKEEVKDFIKPYQDVLSKLPEDTKIKLIYTHDHGVSLSASEYEREVIETLKEVTKIMPPLEQNIVVFRHDENNEYDNQDRPWHAHSFLPEGTNEFANIKTVYEVIIPKGSRILPTCALDLLGAFTEQEVILEKEKIKPLTENLYIYMP